MVIPANIPGVKLSRKTRLRYFLDMKKPAIYAFTSVLLVASSCLGCSQSEQRVAHEPVDAEPSKILPSQSSEACFRQLLTDLEEEWPRNKTINIVAFGHSVPAGFGATTKIEMLDAYPRRLEDALAARYPHAVLNVINSGVGGNRSDQGLARIETDVLDHHPRVVLIDFALNDRSLSLAESEKNLSTIVEAVRKIGACPVLMTPTWDMKSNPGDPEDPLLAQAQMIRALAAEKEVQLADSYSAFSEMKGGPKSLMATFNHPNAAGHAVILQQLLPLFEAR